MRILGPNCLGVIAPHFSLNVSFARECRKKGILLLFLSQALYAHQCWIGQLKRKIGFSYFISVGNMLDIDFGDLIDYLGEDEKTESNSIIYRIHNSGKKIYDCRKSLCNFKTNYRIKAGRYPESAKVGIFPYRCDGF